MSTDCGATSDTTAVPRVGLMIAIEFSPRSMRGEMLIGRYTTNGADPYGFVRGFLYTMRINRLLTDDAMHCE